MKKMYLYLLLILLFAMHLPFLDADPDSLVDINTRGAWTDEGLYSSQIRNFVNGYGFDLEENSTFVRGPVFNIIQLPFFYIFGTKLIVGRLIVLVLTFLTILLFARLKNYETFTFFVSIITLTQFHIFQFTHYALAEMLCIDFVLLGLYFLIKFYQGERKKILLLFFSSMMIFLSYSTKIQYLYALAILPLTVFVISLQKCFLGKSRVKKELIINFWTTGFSILFLGIYFLVWYLPNSEFYNYVMFREAFQRFPEKLAQYPGAIKFSFLHILWIKELKIYLLIFFFSVLLLILSIFKKNIIKPSFVPLVFMIIWILIELHKIPMNYLPYRYLLSLIFVIGIFVSLIFSSLAKINSGFKITLIIAVLLIGIYNTSFNYNAFSRRTHDLKNTNKYLLKHDLSGKTILGPWTASVSWETKAKTLPVWNNFLNFESPIKKHNPILVISEKNESESDKAYSTQNIKLEEISDSIKNYKIWRYDVNLFWINKNLQYETNDDRDVH